MGNNVFISFRYDDGVNYKEELSELFKNDDDTFDYSEDEDRSKYDDETIKKYLYSKLKKSTVTIVLITPQAVNHKKNMYGHYDDWMYDEIRYSLEDRENNRTNGLIAVYTPEAKQYLMHSSNHYCDVCKTNSNVNTILAIDNLCRKNMMNIKDEYKTNKCRGVYDAALDSYCSLISFEEFKENFNEYINSAKEKRDNIYKYDIKRRLQ